jgi:DNA-binding response OmpR family regulator
MTQRERTKNIIQAGEFTLNLEKTTLHKGGTEYHLSPKEAKLLALLMTNAGQVVARQKILEEVWHIDDPPASRTLDVHIHWLRQKVEDIPNIPDHILTHRGLGYTLRVNKP